MVKIIALLISCLALATVAESKPTSNEAAPSPLCANCETSETQIRPKRHVEEILQAVGGMVTQWIHEIAIHRQQRRAQRQRYRNNKATFIGNGEGNTNHVTYNIYNNP